MFTQAKQRLRAEREENPVARHTKRRSPQMRNAFALLAFGEVAFGVSDGAEFVGSRLGLGHHDEILFLLLLTGQFVLFPTVAASLVALDVVRDRQSGIWQDLLVTQLSTVELLRGKLVPFLRAAVPWAVVPALFGGARWGWTGALFIAAGAAGATLVGAAQGLQAGLLADDLLGATLRAAALPLVARVLAGAVLLAVASLGGVGSEAGFASFLLSAATMSLVLFLKVWDNCILACDARSA